MITIVPKKTTLADRIRSMSDEELNDFLFRFKINACYLLIEKDKLLTSKQQLEILQTDERLRDVHYSEFSGVFLCPLKMRGNFMKVETSN